MKFILMRFYDGGGLATHKIVRCNEDDLVDHCEKFEQEWLQLLYRHPEKQWAFMAREIFEYSPKPGEAINKEIIPGIFCCVPLSLNKDYNTDVLYSDKKFKLLKQQTDLISDTLTTNNKFVRLADVIITWNYIQHFYPYFNVVERDWDEVLLETLSESLRDKNKDEFLLTLRQMMSHLNDGHGYVQDLNANDGRLPVKLDLVESQVIVISSKDSSKFKIGDIFLEIDDKNIKKELLKAEKYISGSKQWKRNRALNQICIGPKNIKTKIKLLRNKDTIICFALKDYDRYLKSDKPKFMEFDNNIFYVNLNNSLMKDIDIHIDKIIEAKGVIFDLRVYPENNHEILSYLIDKKTSQNWMQVPQIIYPDHKNFRFKKFGWKLKPKYPQIKGEIVFITSSRAISYAESVLGFVEGYNLGEIVGQQTAGANGNVVCFSLPGNYIVQFTGMKVVKHNGSQHHTIGIKPTVYVEKTIEGVKSGRDEFLEKAIEVLNDKIK